MEMESILGVKNKDEELQEQKSPMYHIWVVNHAKGQLDNNKEYQNNDKEWDISSVQNGKALANRAESKIPGTTV